MINNLYLSIKPENKTERDFWKRPLFVTFFSQITASNGLQISDPGFESYSTSMQIDLSDGS